MLEEEALAHLLALLVHALLLVECADVHEHDGVVDERVLDLSVELGVGGEARRMVDLEHVGLELLVDEYVVAEYLEASAALVVVGEARAIVVLEHGVCGQNDLDDDVVDVRPHLVHVVAVLAQPFVYCRYASLFSTALRNKTIYFYKNFLHILFCSLTRHGYLLVPVSSSRINSSLLFWMA